MQPYRKEWLCPLFFTIPNSNCGFTIFQQDNANSINNRTLRLQNRHSPRIVTDWAFVWFLGSSCARSSAIYATSTAWHRTHVLLASRLTDAFICRCYILCASQFYLLFSSHENTKRMIWILHANLRFIIKLISSSGSRNVILLRCMFNVKSFLSCVLWYTLPSKQPKLCVYKLCITTESRLKNPQNSWLKNLHLKYIIFLTEIYGINVLLMFPDIFLWFLSAFTLVEINLFFEVNNSVYTFCNWINIKI